MTSGTAVDGLEAGRGERGSAGGLCDVAGRMKRSKMRL